jgi:two-component system, probable response regulator PhcQ
LDATILIVDDDRYLLQAQTRLLHGQPYSVLTARDAAEAEYILKTRAVDLVVCDEWMPGTLGTEFLAWVAQAFPNVVRIILTGQPSIDSAMRAVNEGRVFRYLIKPCNDYVLAMAIHDGLDQIRSQASTPLSSASIPAESSAARCPD